ncbi:hypothetical protein [Synechococcus sp. PCC 7336]|uniref:hypothetical protein n=1 Tax=Synechococcus sp. PCC 7336 TaxID=195250 RepID=UPI00034C341F|nr:hypothetical protein [Synechococcus sp. PCC 7336]
MPVAADFVTLLDTTSILSSIYPGDSDSVTFVENISEAPQLGEGGLLTWNALRQADFDIVEGNVTYQVRVNGNYVVGHTERVTDWHAVQEIIPTNTIIQGNNNVEFRVISPNGRLFISDIVLWYRKNV